MSPTIQQAERAAHLLTLMRARHPRLIAAEERIDSLCTEMAMLEEVLHNCSLSDLAYTCAHSESLHARLCTEQTLFNGLIVLCRLRPTEANLYGLKRLRLRHADARGALRKLRWEAQASTLTILYYTEADSVGHQTLMLPSRYGRLFTFIEESVAHEILQEHADPVAAFKTLLAPYLAKRIDLYEKRAVHERFFMEVPSLAESGAIQLIAAMYRLLLRLWDGTHDVPNAPTTRAMIAWLGFKWTEAFDRRWVNSTLLNGS